MILTTTSPHRGYSFLEKYYKEINRVPESCLWTGPPNVEAGDEVTLPDNTKLVVFTGGEDVSPYLYNRKPHQTVYFSRDRDLWEILIWQAAQRQKIPVLGICRGLQFINVMCGGELVQHTTGHAGQPHKIICLDDKIKEFTGGYVTSLHHQMVLPPKNAEVAAVSSRRSGFYLTAARCDEDEEKSSYGLDVKEEVEAVIYKDQRALGVQFHPELSSPLLQCDIEITQRLIEEYLL